MPDAGFGQIKPAAHEVRRQANMVSERGKRERREDFVLRKFLEANEKLCDRLVPYLPQREPHIYELYEQTVARRMNAERGRIVVDVGGGKSCPFARLRDPAMDAKIVAVDISSEEMAGNTDVDETRVADIMRSLPFEDASVDMVVSRSVLEHLQSVEGFVSSSGRALRPGGHFIHLFPSRFAPFALINQLLPGWLGKRVLYFLRPVSRGIGGFPAFYDSCNYSAIVPMLERRGFEVEEEHLSYYQSHYFDFFLPLFVLSALYEVAVRAFGVKDLAAFVLIVARKKEARP